jgi:hypothetical protein
MTYNEIFVKLSFEKTKLITTKCYDPQKIIKSLSLVVRSSMEPKYELVMILLQCIPTKKDFFFPVTWAHPIINSHAIMHIP